MHDLNSFGLKELINAKFFCESLFANAECMSSMDKGESVSGQFSRSLKIIDESGVAYSLNQLGTLLEGEFEEVITLV